MPMLPKFIDRANFDLRLPRPPFWLVALLLALVALSWVPLVLIARARMVPSDQPRVHLIQDMDNQPRFKPQDATALFADGRAMRPPVAGTVNRNAVVGDPLYTHGFTLQTDPATGQPAAQFAQDLPERFEVNRAFLERGRRQFNIYCATCHGYTGEGNGPIHQRALELQEPRWVPPTNLTDAERSKRPAGHLYNTITNGIRNMAPYGGQIAVDDRWAIVAYLRALQLSRNATIEDVPAGAKDQLK